MYQKEYYKQNKEKIRQAQKEYYERNKEKIIANKNKRYENNKDQIDENRKKWKQKNKTKIKLQQAKYNEKYYIENKEAVLLRQKQYHKNNIKKIKEYNYKKAYPNGDYQTYLNSKSCEICSKLFDTKSKKNQDHNHTTNEIRGVICYRCNSILGYAEDNQNILQSTIDYLKRHAS